MINGNLSVDAFTGLPNLFELIESANAGAFGKSGMILAIHLADLPTIIRNYGLKAGESAIQVLAEALRKNEYLQGRACSTIAFRIGDEEFLLIAPGMKKNEGARLAQAIEGAYQEQLRLYGLDGIRLQLAQIPYGKKGATTSTLLKAAYLALADYQYLPGAVPSWVEGLIDNLVDKICETLKLLRQAHSMAFSDEISGLPNHRAGEFFITDTLNESKQNNEAFSILFIDGDNLRQYNDNGYRYGNKMIRELGLLIKKQLRRRDRLARWLSGDEFLAILPEADREEAFQVAERLRAAVEEETKRWSYPITISIGVASYPLDGENMDELLQRAEKANSLAKREGKNRVCEAGAAFY